MYNNVLVTGGSGFLGKRLKLIRPDWTYVSSRHYDLTNPQECRQMYLDTNPDSVIHLAARVGGIKDNDSKQAEYYFQNTMINTNVVHEAYKIGVKRVLASLSTCAFPDKLDSYPFNEGALLLGPPAPTNMSYGYTKRSLHIQCRSYRKQYGLNYSTFCPSNIYGPEDHFDTEASHFVPSLISKLSNLSEDTLSLWGTGSPLRQQLYVDDLAKIIPILLEKHNTSLPLIVAPDENLSIKEMAEIAIKKMNKSVIIKYNGKLDGQYRKDGDNSKLKEMIGDFEFTTFAQGVEKTYKWYKENK